MDNFREWISDNIRYILLGLAGILVLVIVIFAARWIKDTVGGKDPKDENVQVTEKQSRNFRRWGKEQRNRAITDRADNGRWRAEKERSGNFSDCAGIIIKHTRSMTQ